jgi:hypothetical protein
MCWFSRKDLVTCRVNGNKYPTLPIPMAPLRRGFASPRFLGLRVRIPPEELKFVSYECCVLSGIRLRVGLIIRPEEFYQVRYVQWVWSRSPVRPWPGNGSKRQKKYIYIYTLYIYIYIHIRVCVCMCIYIYIHTYTHTFYVTVRPRNLKLVFIRIVAFLICHRTIFQCHIERCKFKLFILFHQAAVAELLNKYLIIRSLTLQTTNHRTVYSADLIPSIITVNWLTAP